LLQDEVLRWPQGRSLILQARYNPAWLYLPDLSEWPAAEDLIPAGLEELKKEVMSVPVWIPEIEIDEREKKECQTELIKSVIKLR